MIENEEEKKALIQILDNAIRHEGSVIAQSGLQNISAHKAVIGNIEYFAQKVSEVKFDKEKPKKK